jgi:hypothetical protein
MKYVHTVRRGHSYLTRVDEDVIARVRLAKIRGFSETFWTGRGWVPVRVERRSDADLYQRMMAAKGLQVRVGAA